jgi:hypothetical protein
MPKIPFFPNDNAIRPIILSYNDVATIKPKTKYSRLFNGRNKEKQKYMFTFSRVINDKIKSSKICFLNMHEYVSVSYLYMW